MTETIASAVERFIAHKRAHGRKYNSEARELVLLVRFAAEHQVSCLGGLTPALLEDFLASRPRSHPRGFNHLLGVVRCLLDWAVTWGLLEASPLQARRHRVTEQRIPFLFDPVQARRLRVLVKGLLLRVARPTTTHIATNRGLRAGSPACRGQSGSRRRSPISHQGSRPRAPPGVTGTSRYHRHKSCPSQVRHRVPGWR
jgi:hypothetical protein